MFIKKLEIYGFKSFPYKVSIPFSSGITAIVGPNGVGKSNILDAIRWVLGEQSPKKLRIKELSDLIFSGNSDRKIDFAEVKLFLNHDPPLWETYKDFTEIVITRRFYRDEESEFFINQKPCRLKDIHFLFLDLGINPQSYGIIEQGEVGKFIELSPKERRIFLEDLAGVSRLRVTEEETIKNLQKTEENLVRLKDIINEVKIQYENLKKQSEEAKQYLNLRENLQELLIKKNLCLLNTTQKEIESIKKISEKIVHKHQSLEKEIENFEKKENEIYQEILLLERKIKDLKSEIQNKEIYYKKQKETLENLIKQENELVYKLEKIKLKRETEEEKFNNISQEILFIESNLEKLKIAYETLTKDFETLNQEKEETQKKFDEKIKIFQNFEKDCFLLTKDKEKINEQLESLEKEILQLKKEKEINKKVFQDLITNLEKITKEKEILISLIKEKEIKEKTLTQNLEKLIKEREEINRKIKVLNEEKQKILIQIQSLKDRINLIEKIISQNKISNLSILKKFNLPPLETYLDLNHEDMFFLELIFRENLNALAIEDLTLIKKIVSENFEENITLLWAKPEVIKSFFIEKHSNISDEILESYKNYPRFIYFIKEKVLLTPYNFIYFIRKEEKGIFSFKKEKEELLRNIEFLEKNLRNFVEKEKELSNFLEKLEKDYKNLERDFKSNNKELENLKTQKEKIEISAVKFEERKESLEEKIKILETKIKNLENEKKQFVKELKNIIELINKEEKKYEVIKKEKSVFENKLKELTEKLHSLNQEIIKIQTQKENLKIRKFSLVKESEKTKAVLKQFEFDKETLVKELDYVRGKINEFTEKVKQLKSEISKLNQKLETLFMKKEENHQLLKTLEGKKRKLEKGLKEVNTEKHNLELRLLEKSLILDSVIKELKELKFEKKKSEFYKESVEKFKIEEIEKEIEETKKLLNEFKEVNLASIREFEVVSQRYTQLMRQKEDLEVSIKEFKKILEKIREVAKERILETLERVNKKLNEIFPMVFKNGKAELVLLGDDPLSSGLDIKIGIPHKGLKHINMLSGGEKALCVLVILISFYLVKPGPFCILDEVDAFLDEKNSLQFIKLLNLIKKTSQVILITHNSHIMKEVDTLLGVTMEEKGISKVFILKKENFFNASIHQ